MREKKNSSPHFSPLAPKVSHLHGPLRSRRTAECLFWLAITQGEASGGIQGGEGCEGCRPRCSRRAAGRRQPQKTHARSHLCG